MDEVAELLSRSVASDGYITYASFAADEGVSSGGWRIGQRVGVGEDDAEELVKLAPVQLASDVPVPRYVDETTRKRLVRRATWARTPGLGGGYVFVHSTPAGNDASGRSGNVFSSMYVFSEAAMRETRPVQLIDSPSLLVPFNKEVNRATVDSRELVLNPENNPQDALAALMAAHSQGFTHVRDIVATVLDALYTSPNVVIGDDPRNAGAWLTLITYALDRSTARDISWSTYERLASFRGAGAGAGGIAFIPAHEMEALRQESSGLVAIDARAGVRRGQWRDAHTSYGESGDDELEAHPISELFAFVLNDSGAAGRLLEEPVSAGRWPDKLAALALSTPTDALDTVGAALVQVAGQRTSGGELDALIAQLPKQHRDRLRAQGHTEAPADEPQHRPRFNMPPDGGDSPVQSNPFAPGIGATSAQPQEQPPTSAPASAAGTGQTARTRPVTPELIDAIERLTKEYGTSWPWQPNLNVKGWEITGWPSITELLLVDAEPHSEIARLQRLLFGTAAVTAIQYPEAEREIMWLPFWRLAEYDDAAKRDVIDHAQRWLSPLIGSKSRTATLHDNAEEFLRSHGTGEAAALVEKLRIFLHEQHEDHLRHTSGEPYRGPRERRRAQEIPPRQNPGQQTNRTAGFGPWK